MARVIQVIETVETRGKGKDESDPIRGVKQYYTFDGDLLAEADAFDFGMIERGRLREAIFQLLNNMDSVQHADAVGTKRHLVRAADVAALQAAVSAGMRTETKED